MFCQTPIRRSLIKIALTAMAPMKTPPAKRKGASYCCPKAGCKWTTAVRTSYYRHWDAEHSLTFRYICDRCEAGQNRLCRHIRHVRKCEGKDANLKRRGKRPRFASSSQMRATHPPAEEEAVQGLEVQLEGVERENEKLKADKVKLEESLERVERENEQLKEDKVKLEDTFEKVEREKEELRTYVVKLEVQLKEMDGHGQENALEEEEGQGNNGELEVDVSIRGVQNTPNTPSVLVLGADMEREPLMEDVSVMVLQGDKELVLEAVMDPEPVMEDGLEENMELVLEAHNMELVLEDEEDVPDQPTPRRSTRERKGPGMVEHQLVDEVLETGGKVLYMGRRKSTRRTGAILQMEKDAAIEARLRSNVDSDLLQVVDIEGKGRAVKTLQPISKADYVVEYAGDLIDAGVAKDKEEEYAMDLSKGCYLFYFLVGGKKYCVDATTESGRLGRLLNHSMLYPNCGTKVAMVDGRPRLYFVAKQEIPAGTELVFDYGDRSKASLVANPWLAL